VDPARRPTLALLPAGTGNDLCRSLGVPGDLRAATELLRDGRRARIDVVHARFPDHERCLVNAGAGGWSGAVSGALDAGTKAGWGPLAYLLGAAQALPELRWHPVVVRCDGGDAQAFSTCSIVVANGRYVAGGVEVAPEALLDDGALDLLVVRQGPLLELAALGARVAAGREVEHGDERVFRCRGRRIELELPGTVTFNLDGELQGAAPAVFEVEPGALEVVCARDAPALRPPHRAVRGDRG
jgi:diacylglycerol kinase (ATP)